jgi:hypothetical protein
MRDRPPRNEIEAEACRQVVTLARSMLAGELSFIEGAVQVASLRTRIGGLPDRDNDFDAFVLISSETDHLPLQAQRHLWSERALAAVAPDFERVQQWASGFAPQACINLIERLGLWPPTNT